MRRVHRPSNQWYPTRSTTERMAAARIPHDFVPKTDEDLARCLADPEWRLFSGALYKIMVKGDGDEEAMVLPFVPNQAQRRFMRRLWHRNLILKARQLGFTTLIAILWLDHALFNADQRCGIVAQDREAAEAIFRDKVRFAYQNLPEPLRERFPLARDSATELLFAHNNSSVRVATSVRSGTIHRLHISEFGKICAKYPDKAQEVVTGSIPAVPTNGIVVIESTAEGREGAFYGMTQRALAQHQARALLTPKDYRFHFYAWWQEPKYRLPAGSVYVSEEDHAYFDEIEGVMQCSIDDEQRTWYVATREADFSGAEEKMWQEYPSTPDEAFQISTEGHYYTKNMAELRKRGGLRAIPIADEPVYTFWDIGNSDGTAIWFMQIVAGEDRFIDYLEGHGEDLAEYARQLRAKGYVFAVHFLPHDADHKRLNDRGNRSTREMLEGLLPSDEFEVVPRIEDLMTGVHMARKWMKTVFIDKDRCKLGIQRLEGYKKKFNRTDSCYVNQPDKTNGCSEGADAFRQYAQAKDAGLIGGRSTASTLRRRGSGFAR